MKSRWLALSVAVAAFSAVPWTMGANTAAWSESRSDAESGSNESGSNEPRSNPDTDANSSSGPDTDKGQPKAADVQNVPAPPPANLPTQDDSQIKHDGTKTDVDAVGNRNVGCGRGVGNWYSIERQVAMGARMLSRLNRRSSW